MHELAATRGMLTAALERMRQVGATRVTRVELTIGASGHLTEDAVRQHFELLAQGTPAEGAALTFSWLPATYQCFTCLQEFASTAPPSEIACPACGGVALEVAHEETYYASMIEVAFAADETGAAAQAIPAAPAQ
jgi:hydrogenase nickel incorporation protein HypA/HybF